MNPRTIKKQVFSRLFNLTEHDLTAYRTQANTVAHAKWSASLLDVFGGSLPTLQLTNSSTAKVYTSVLIS